MSRRYPTAELYEERERDFYRGNGNRSERNYEELDIELRRSGEPRRSVPDFLREDYNRPTAGPMVLRPREDDHVSRGPRSTRGFDDDAGSVSVRSSRPPPPPASVRGFDRDDVSVRRSARPREEETDITIRRREQSRPRQPEFREPDFERNEIPFRRGDGAPPRPREVEIEKEDIRFRTRGDSVDIRATHKEVGREGRGVSAERGSIRFQERDGNFDFRTSRREQSRGRDRSTERETITIRGREKSLPPPRSRGELVAREREEFVIRRREASPPSPPPPRPREIIRDEIIIRRKEERSPSPAPSPPPPPPAPAPEPEIRPPIIQEIITHHRHIDHGVERARSPTPPPPPPPPAPRNESIEIEINRRETRNGRSDFEELDININRDSRHDRGELEIRARERSFSPPRRSHTAPIGDDFDLEAEYYNRKAMERSYMGEAWNGATKDWAIVDVPPGTNRIRMDGAGGGAQEVTWQRYNGVRRSKFISADDERVTDFGPVKPKKKDMWTEITKDLVLKDAIESMGYKCEETDDFFYVMEYLRYVSFPHPSPPATEP
ncbi:hypothetical protein P153DRAFT_9407 [Dothidotthia symphoricarpi CBS 119687]|uniref:DUF8035 domain-containing protein n=1 Tax=Dothidotthia symphoricarpi CBS 119687 TaxID=1392245 RepID=A0A6A6AT73_9PLEO|nr:uncharacterized protein P153DRAFT_9407 [Dothidotthia symphoricarpi CBS 119687]KAF2134776.1 hypothetical protein P153DRAFT_9407 [Dothidotthia symphoricarpi CBS 119687]